MKKLLIGFGILLFIASLISIGQYIGDYKQLSEYGKGFIWGKILVLLIGGIMIFLGWKRKRAD